MTTPKIWTIYTKTFGLFYCVGNVPKPTFSFMWTMSPQLCTRSPIFFWVQRPLYWGQCHLRTMSPLLRTMSPLLRTMSPYSGDIVVQPQFLVCSLQHDTATLYYITCLVTHHCTWLYIMLLWHNQGICFCFYRSRYSPRSSFSSSVKTTVQQFLSCLSQLDLCGFHW